MSAICDIKMLRPARGVYNSVRGIVVEAPLLPALLTILLLVTGLSGIRLARRG